METQVSHNPLELKASDIPKRLVIDTKVPSLAPRAEESLEFHAARILLLLRHAGGRSGKIVGRTKLAKMDFFVRYPSFLNKAVVKLGEETIFFEKVNPESLMIRYKYGPWDQRYYDVFAFLVAKELIDITPTENGDAFSLTTKGISAAEELEGPEFDEVVLRCQIVYRLFGKSSGSVIKQFIYDNFPEIVAKELGAEITP